MGFKASHKYARISPRKVRSLADMIRGQRADVALDILKYQPHRGARLLEKVLRSALGSAMDPDQTLVKVHALSNSLSAMHASMGVRCSSGCDLEHGAWRM